MKVVVTGGGGFVGLALARALLARGRLTAPSGREEEIDSLVLLDAVPPAQAPADPRVELAAGDVCDVGLLARLVDRDDCSVFHLASVVSAGAEADFDLALRVNLDGGRAVLEACRARGSRPRLVFASSIGVFGGEAVADAVGDRTKQTPETTYGATKAICELLVNDYTRRGFLDGRSARLPTVVVRPGAPNLAGSGFVSAVVREPLAGRDYTLPVGPETRMPVIGHRAVADGLVRLHELPGEALGHDRAVCFPALDATPGDLLEALRRVAVDRPLGRVDVRVDPAIEAMTRTWPGRVDASRALQLGLPLEPDLDAVVRAYVEDFVPAPAPAA